MNHPLNFLLRVGRSDDERVSLLGDLQEEHRARLARGSSRLAALAWYTTEIVRAVVWGLRDTVGRRTFARRAAHVAPGTRRPAPSARLMLSWPDIKLSFRLLIRNPGLTIVSTVGITVGIAITSGMFGFVHATFAPTLPLDEGDRIVGLENWDIARNNEEQHSLHDFVTWRDEMTSVVEISAFEPSSRRCRQAIGCRKPSGLPR